MLGGLKAECQWPKLLKKGWGAFQKEKPEHPKIENI